jgi:threonine/homoserine/homoserine lactone efflux protein
MSFLAFLLEATLISLSGILAPGPITAVVVGKGGKSPHAGALVAIGHGIAEVPLMVAVFCGVGRLMELSYVRAGIGLLGGMLLLVMGVGMLRSIRKAEVGSGQDTRSPIVAGALLSIGNPYFLVWWATVGAALIMRSFRFGVLGFVAFGALHWLCDLAWDYFLSALSFKGGAFFGRRFQQVVFAVCGMFLVFSSARLLVEAAKVASG